MCGGPTMMCPMSLPVKIKICGVRTPEVAEAAIGAGAEFIGLMFVPNSPRYLTDREGGELSAAMGNRAKSIGVFKEESPTRIKQVAERMSLWGVQLHGDWDAQDVAWLAPHRVIGAVPFDLPRIEAAIKCAGLTALLIDAPDPTGLGGGTGTKLDWHSLRQALDRLKPAVPIVLAGGLTPDNVQEAIRAVHPWAVDVSSGVESSRGVKDPGRVRAFCQAVHDASK